MMCPVPPSRPVTLDDMDSIGLVVSTISSWPDRDLERASRLLRVTAERCGDPIELGDLQLDLAAFEAELDRRRVN